MTETACPATADERISIEPCGKRVQATFKGEVIADSERALVMRETGYPPRIYFPRADVRMDLLRPTAHKTHCPFKGDAAYWTLSVGGATLENAAWAYPETLPGVAAIAGHLSFAEAVQTDL